MTYPGLIAGLLLFVALLVRQGVGEVGAAIAVAGPGLLVVALFHVVSMFGHAMGWRELLVRKPPRVGTALFGRWVGESVNGLLPVMQVGGNVARARYLARYGVPGDEAAASVVVDVTLIVLTQIVFTLLGTALLLMHLGGSRIALAAVAGMALMAMLVGGFFVAQRRGIFAGLTRFSGRLARGVDLTALGAEASAIDASVARLWRERGALARSSAWHCAAWVLGAGEIWLALYYLGHPVDVRTALLIESLTQAVRAGAFAVPGALGVQEGGYLLLGGALGLGPDTSLALALTKRVRDLVLGLPGLIAWQVDVVTSRVRTRARDGRGVTT
jgi:putative membrane protein